MSDRTYTVALTGSDLVLLRSALDLEVARQVDVQRSIRHTKRCTNHEAEQRYPAYRLAGTNAKRCMELQRVLLEPLEPPA